jgi:Gpi18-like mannosyltransferase
MYLNTKNEESDARFLAAAQAQDASTNASDIQSSHLSAAFVVDDTQPTTYTNKHSKVQAFWTRWYTAFKGVLPVYIAVHLAFVVATYFSFLFIFPDSSTYAQPLHSLWQLWSRKDTGHYIWIATHGYTQAWRTAFFPLYPLLERYLMALTHNPFTAGLLISNLAGLVLLTVLYRLVLEDFDREQAYRTILYLSVFPTAFFFASAYNESLFLCLSLLSFYHMRHGHWWLAGLFGFLASLTRSAGLLLILPFCYEYLRQHNDNTRTSFQRVKKILYILKAIRFDVLGGILIPAGLVLFALYCYIQFHDPLSFSHAQTIWHRQLQPPWYGIVSSINVIIQSRGLISFPAIRNVFELGSDLFICALLILSFVGPWRFPRNLRAYSLYAAIFFLFQQLYPVSNIFPLGSLPRFMLELFPAFIVLAGVGKNQSFHVTYLMVSCSMLFLLLVVFLTGTWLT